jgi:predicted negative regulator of RcsB-dependent stress response
MSEVTQTQTLEQTLNKTDLGHVIYENRKIFFGIILAVLVLVTGFLLWKQSQKSSALDNSLKVFEFQSTVWNDVKEGKKTVPELVKSFEALPANVQSSPVMIPVALEIGKYLFDKGNLEEADLILSKVTPKDHHSVGPFFLSSQRAVILEKLGKIDAAIEVLLPLAQMKDSFMPAKVAIDLGRLYLLKGEKGKAQTQFDYVLTTFPNDDFAKMAKLYLQQMAQ